jgi:hypothetical protein
MVEVRAHSRHGVGIFPVLCRLSEIFQQALGESAGILRNEVVEPAGELFWDFERRQCQFGANFVFEQVGF